MVLRVGCVPEHFSAPLVQAVERGNFPGDEEIKLVLLGTGDMVRRLEAGELDVAICVTEGLVAGIGDNGMKLFGTYVDTPLPWAVSVKHGSKYASLDDLAFGATFGVSRNGSGSDIMARYMGSHFEWPGAPRTCVLGDINGLIRGVQSGEADAFLWERTTMQRHYAKSEVAYLGTVRPPWPAFSYAALGPFIRENPERLRLFVRWAREMAAEFMRGIEGNRAFVCREFGYSSEDVDAWAAYVGFSEDGRVDRGRIEKAILALERAGVVNGLGVDDVVMTPE